MSMESPTTRDCSTYVPISTWGTWDWQPALALVAGVPLAPDAPDVGDVDTETELEVERSSVTAEPSGSAEEQADTANPAAITIDTNLRA